MNEQRPESGEPVSVSSTYAAPREESDSVDYDRRGKPLPPKQRVGGIITPQ